MTHQTPTPDRGPYPIALDALVWTLGNPARAERLLATTGLDPATLRERVGEASLLAAVLTFLEAHEPDLIACAAALDLPASALVRVRAALENA
ncbi:DUF3572 family protein [Sphingomonas sp.]